MSIKTKLIEKIQERLILLEEAGFSQDNSKIFIENLEQVPEKNFHNVKDMNHICNYVIGTFEYVFSPAEELDSMGESKWDYYISLMDRGFNNLRTKIEKNDYFDFSHLKKSGMSALDNRVIHAREARIPLWEQHDALEDNSHHLFREHKDLVFRYRQILNNNFWNDYTFKKFYNENIDQTKLTKLHKRVLKWFVDQPEKEIEEICNSAGDYRVVALAYSAFEKDSEKFFKGALKREKANKNYWNQEQILSDMKQAGIKSSNWDKFKVYFFVK